MLRENWPACLCTSCDFLPFLPCLLVLGCMSLAGYMGEKKENLGSLCSLSSSPKVHRQSATFFKAFGVLLVFRYLLNNFLGVWVYKGVAGKLVCAILSCNQQL